VALAACARGSAIEPEVVPQYTYRVVHVYPHDQTAFTEGLFYWRGSLYEGTGLNRESSIRKVDLETGRVLQKRELEGHFGEGIINWRDTLLELTWQAHVGFKYDLSTFTPKGTFQYGGEGWGLTQDGKRIIMSDGTPQIRFWDPATLKETGRITVSHAGRQVRYLNELEWVKGEIYANVWQTWLIARIDPTSGRVLGWIDCTGILNSSDTQEGYTDVMNGIAYDAAKDRLFVTGKRWPKLFEIKLVRKR
jgi:glutaminyl-peptide cyclotransferase